MKETFRHELSSRDIQYTRHFEKERLPYRQNVTKSLIEQHLENPDNLIDFVHSEDGHEREKYEAIFDKSSKYYLKIVLSMADESLYIVTAHVINKARRERSQVIE